MLLQKEQTLVLVLPCPIFPLKKNLLLLLLPMRLPWKLKHLPSSVVVVTIKTGTSVSATTIPADSLSLPPPAAEFSHNKPSVSLPLVSDNLFYVEVKEDQDIPLCLIPSCNHKYTEGYPLMPVGRQGKFLYKQLKVQFPLPVYSHFIFESINDTRFFLIVETDMNIEHLMQHFLNTDFRGNLVPLLRSLGVITGERLIYKTLRAPRIQILGCGMALMSAYRISNPSGRL